jgi:hypothetical protein
MNWVKGSDLSAIVKKFKSEPQNIEQGMKKAEGDEPRQ